MINFRALFLFFMLACFSFHAGAACQTWSTKNRFSFTGAEVRDKRTGLVWSRCSVGQEWTGNSCVGSPIAFTHEQALQYAESRNGWRLPNRRELFSLVDKGCYMPAIDVEAFPGTISDDYWTSSPRVRSSNYAWVVDFSDGRVSEAGARHPIALYVRLLRISP
mgnify:CR=1 FL=1